MNAVTDLALAPLSVKRIDDAALAAYVAGSKAATPFHDPRWGRAVEAATGHRFLTLGAVRGDGSIAAVLPLHCVRSRLFGDRLASTAFAVGGGILADSPAAVTALASAAQALAAELGVRDVSLRGGEMPRGWRIDDWTHLSFARPLAADRDAELAVIPRKHRAEVRKALAGALTVSVGRSAADRAAHFAVYAASVRNLGTPVFPQALFDAVLDAFGEDTDILTVAHEGVPVASVLSLYWRGAVMPYWGGGTQAARGLRANELMYFELMDHARTRGMTSFDFGRSKNGSGPAAYKKNWGFTPQPLSYASWSVEGGVPHEPNPASPRYRLMVRGWRKLPLALANRLGPVIARQLG